MIQFSRSIHRFCLGLIVSIAILAQDGAAEDRSLWRFEFDNDIIGESDDFFSAGWSLQRHDPYQESWSDFSLTHPSRWISEHVPGIGGGDGLFVRRGFSIGQIIQTPADLSQTELIEDDVPYAGVLGVAESWTALNDQCLNTFQIYLGVLGPASLAEEVQTFVHTDLGLGDDPKGWDNQLDNEPILNLSYLTARKLAATGSRDGFGADLSGSGSLGLGNLFTHAQLGLGTRFGWRMPPGFTHVPDVPGRGVAVEPGLDPGTEGLTRLYVTVVARGSAIAYTVLLDGNTFEDSHHVDYDPYLAQLITGIHATRGALGLHFSVFLSSNPAKESTKSDLTWANITLAYRF